VGYALLVSLVTRTLLAVLEASETGTFWASFRFAWLDRDSATSRPTVTAAIVGWAEALAYPILLHLNQLTAIGLWLGLNTAGGWKGWTDSRTRFMRFLVGNIFVIGFSILAAYLFIR
jgi:hypothetical protein